MKPSLPSANRDLPAPSAAAGARLRYRRVLLKLSGEAFAGPQQSGIDPNIIRSFARQLHEVHDLGCELALVVGGGNIYRGAESSGRGFDRVTGDYMGMLATVINALALQHELEGLGVHTRVMSAIAMQEIAEPYIRRRATRHLEKGRIVIFGGGTGNPYFTTDTAAGLRAMEIGAEVIFKATKVDGVFDADPMLVPTARKYGELSYLEVLKQGLKVMDATAISLCMDNKLPILVFNLLEEGNIRRAVLGEEIGTLVHEGSHDRSGSG